MLIAERQQRLLATLRQRKAAQLDELARELDVSASTARRDLDELERQGLVERTHGGAILRETATSAPPGDIALNRRMGEQVEEKEAIGIAAAALVTPNMTVLLDGGSTVIYAARCIEARPIQVVTNSLAIGHLFADDEQVEVMLVGGNLYPRTGVCVGPMATGSLADLHADLCLFSLAGIFENEAYNINLPMAQVEQVMLQQAAQSILLMDASKFGRKSLVRVCSLDEVDRVVTNTSIDPDWRDRLGDRVVVAGDTT